MTCGGLDGRVLSFLACAGPAAALAVAPPCPRPALAHDADALRTGQALVRAGEPARALAWFDHAAVAAPDLPVAHFGRALCLSMLGRDEEADDALALALSIPSEDGVVPLQLASMCARTGQGTLAMGLLETAVRSNPAIGERALADPSFSVLRDHPRFLMIVGAL